MCMYGVRIFYTWIGLHLSIVFSVRCDSIHVSFMSITSSRDSIWMMLTTTKTTTTTNAVENIPFEWGKIGQTLGAQIVDHQIRRGIIVVDDFERNSVSSWSHEFALDFTFLRNVRQNCVHVKKVKHSHMFIKTSTDIANELPFLSFTLSLSLSLYLYLGGNICCCCFFFSLHIVHMVNHFYFHSTSANISSVTN